MKSSPGPPISCFEPAPPVARMSSPASPKSRSFSLRCPAGSPRCLRLSARRAQAVVQLVGARPAGQLVGTGFAVEEREAGGSRGDRDGVVAAVAMSEM